MAQQIPIGVPDQTYQFDFLPDSTRNRYRFSQGFKKRRLQSILVHQQDTLRKLNLQKIRADDKVGVVRYCRRP